MGRCCKLFRPLTPNRMSRSATLHNERDYNGHMGTDHMDTDHTGTEINNAIGNTDTMGDDTDNKDEKNRDRQPGRLRPPTLQDTIRICEHLRDVHEMGFAQFAGLTGLTGMTGDETKCITRWINPLHWNRVARRILGHRDFGGRLMLLPYSPSCITDRIWVPQGTQHGFVMYRIGTIVSSETTLMFPFDRQCPPTLPYMWYRDQPTHTLICRNIKYGFCRIHPSTNLTLINCELSPADFEHIMNITGQVTMIGTVCDPRCVPQANKASRLTIESSFVPLVTGFSCMHLTIITHPDYDTTAVHTMPQPQDMDTHIAHIGPVVPII